MTDKITFADQVGCIDRELRIREHTYARHVKNGKLTQTAADLELARMRAVRETLLRASTALAEREPGKLETGECWGPAKVRQLERDRILALVRRIAPPEISDKLLAELQMQGTIAQSLEPRS